MTVATGVAHIKITMHEGAVGLERCEDPGCLVDGDGHADCGRLACPACGAGGANLSIAQGADPHGEPCSCTCGHVWVTRA